MFVLFVEVVVKSNKQQSKRRRSCNTWLQPKDIEEEKINSWGGDGGRSVELYHTITMSSKFTQTSPKPAKLGKIGRFAKFVIVLG